MFVYDRDVSELNGSNGFSINGSSSIPFATEQETSMGTASTTFSSSRVDR